jgi:two-component system cell cycle response regulator CtrA
MRVLIATADVFAAASIQVALADENWICDTIDIGEDDFWFSTVNDYDIILLDLIVPAVDGYKMLERLRIARVHTPILILSAHAEVSEKIKFLHCGADDFLTKPFDRRELTARILAIVRRSKGHAASMIRIGKLTINLDTRVVSVGDQPVHLSPKQYGILELLSLRKGTVVREEVFLNHLYGGMDEPESKIVDVLICQLRKKLAQATGGSHYIETQWGQGYVLRDPVAIPAAAAVASPEDLTPRPEEAGTGSVQQRAAGQARVPRRRTGQPLGQIEQRLSDYRSGVRDQSVGRSCAAGSGPGAEPGRVSAIEMRFEDAVTNDGGPLRLPRPDPVYSLFGCATARCHE